MKASAKAMKLHSIAGVMWGATFQGSFNAGSVNYAFAYQAETAAITERKLELTGHLAVIDLGPNARGRSRVLRNIRATLVAAQGGIGNAPPRRKLPPEVYTARADLPVVESTGALSFCGALYLKLAPIDGRALGVSADMKGVQLNARLAPRDDRERELQSAYSSIVDALYGKEPDDTAASAAVVEINRLLAEMKKHGVQLRFSSLGKNPG